MNIKKKIIQEFNFETNKVNFIDLEKLYKNNNELTYIFSSEDENGYLFIFQIYRQ